MAVDWRNRTAGELHTVGAVLWTKQVSVGKTAAVVG